jgi:hypothetical protein
LGCIATAFCGVVFHNKSISSASQKTAVARGRGRVTRYERKGKDWMAECTG